MCVCVCVCVCACVCVFLGILTTHYRATSNKEVSAIGHKFNGDTLHVESHLLNLVIGSVHLILFIAVERLAGMAIYIQHVLISMMQVINQVFIPLYICRIHTVL